MPRFAFLLAGLAACIPAAQGQVAAQQASAAGAADSVPPGAPYADGAALLRSRPLAPRVWLPQRYHLLYAAELRAPGVLLDGHGEHIYNPRASAAAAFTQCGLSGVVEGYLAESPGPDYRRAGLRYGNGFSDAAAMVDAWTWCTRAARSSALPKGISVVAHLAGYLFGMYVAEQHRR